MLRGCIVHVAAGAIVHVPLEYATGHVSRFLPFPLCLHYPSPIEDPLLLENFNFRMAFPGHAPSFRSKIRPLNAAGIFQIFDLASQLIVKYLTIIIVI